MIEFGSPGRAPKSLAVFRLCIATRVRWESQHFGLPDGLLDKILKN